MGYLTLCGSLFLLSISSIGIDLSDELVLRKSDRREICGRELSGTLLIDVRNKLSIGEVAIHDGRYVDAIKHFKDGISALGRLYRSVNVIDDSGMKFALGKSNEFDNDLEGAANIFRGVLASRIRMYEKKFR